MKVFEIWDDRGMKVMEAKLDVKGDDWEWFLKYPMLIYLKAIRLTEEVKEEQDESKTNSNKGN